MGSAIRNSALILLVTCAVATRFDADARAAEASSAHEQPTTYLLDDQKFKIPKSLIESYSPDHSGIGLWAMLPDFRPIDRACGKKGTCDQWIFIVLSTAPAAPLSKQRGGMFVDPTTQKRPGPFGLTEYDNATWSRGVDIYGKHLKTGKFYWVTCNRLPGPLESCFYFEELSGGLSLRYVFRRSQLKDWEQIHTSVLALISSFQKE